MRSARPGPRERGVSTTERLRTLLRESRDELRAAVDAVPREDRERRPGPGQWSVAEVLDHLRIVETSVLGLLARLGEAAADRSLQQADGEYEAPGLEAVVDRSNRFDTEPDYVPSPDAAWEEAFEGLERVRSDLLDALAELRGLPLGTVRFPHPLLGELDGHRWIEFVARHEQRHAAQIREIGRHVGPSVGT